MVFVSDFRHTLTVQPAERSKHLKSFSSPETPPGSPRIGQLRAYVCKLNINHFPIIVQILFECITSVIYFCNAVAPDGLKGKTWGPSSIHQRERGQIINKVQDSQSPKRWSKSAPNLEKSQGMTVPVSGALQDIGKLFI